MMDELMDKNNRHIRNSGRLSRMQTEETATKSGKWIRLVFISFGLLCIVQASLNVCFRLFFETRHRQMTAERDELKQKLQNMSMMSVHTSVFETRHRQMTAERDELKQKLQNLNTFLDSVDKWIYFKGSFYYGSTPALPWQDSREYCQQRGADLIIIDSSGEQEFAHLKFSERRWIGLSDLKREGVWQWVDGSQLTTSFWSPGQPDHRTIAEDCGEINYSNQMWNDRECHTAQQFICEKRMTL